MIARIYTLTANAERLNEACVELSVLARRVAGCDGCLSAEACQDVAGETALVFVERWASQAAWEASKTSLPRDAFAKLGQTLAGPPAVTVLQSL